MTESQRSKEKKNNYHLLFEMPFPAWKNACNMARKNILAHLPNKKALPELTEDEYKLWYSRYLNHIAKNYDYFMSGVITGFPAPSYPREVQDMIAYHKLQKLNRSPAESSTSRIPPPAESSTYRIPPPPPIFSKPKTENHSLDKSMPPPGFVAPKGAENNDLDASEDCDKTVIFDVGRKSKSSKSELQAVQDRESRKRRPEVEGAHHSKHRRVEESLPVNKRECSQSQTKPRENSSDSEVEILDITSSKNLFSPAEQQFPATVNKSEKPSSTSNPFQQFPVISPRTTGFTFKSEEEFTSKVEIIVKRVLENSLVERGLVCNGGVKTKSSLSHSQGRHNRDHSVERSRNHSAERSKPRNKHNETEVNNTSGFRIDKNLVCKSIQRKVIPELSPEPGSSNSNATENSSCYSCTHGIECWNCPSSSYYAGSKTGSQKHSHSRHRSSDRKRENSKDKGRLNSKDREWVTTNSKDNERISSKDTDRHNNSKDRHRESVRIKKNRFSSENSFAADNIEPIVKPSSKRIEEDASPIEIGSPSIIPPVLPGISQAPLTPVMTGEQESACEKCVLGLECWDC